MLNILQTLNQFREKLFILYSHNYCKQALNGKQYNQANPFNCSDKIALGMQQQSFFKLDNKQLIN